MDIFNMLNMIGGLSLFLYGMGFILEDILFGLERVSDHCSNIAVEMIAIFDNDYNTHEYFRNFSTEERRSFEKEYEELIKRYPICRNDGMMTT